jgi:hypothetical protein
MGTWAATKNRFVVYFNIMDFKNMVFRNDHKVVLEMMKYLCDRLAEIGKRERTSSQIKHVLFSDSLLMLSEDDSLNAAQELSLAAAQLLAASLFKGISMKGVMAYGRLTADFRRSIHFGEPIIEASLMERELMMHSVLLHHTAEEKMSEYKLLNSRDGLMDVVKYKTPMISGKVYHHVLDWTKVNDGISPVETLNNLYSRISGAARICVDNTFEFVQYVSRRSETNGIKYLSPLLSR